LKEYSKGKLFNGEVSEHAESKTNSAGLPHAQYTLPATGRSTVLWAPDCYIRAKETVTSPVVLYGCETWSLMVKELHRVLVFEDRVLRKIFGPKRK
jgi:hypothetical protein